MAASRSRETETLSSTILRRVLFGSTLRAPASAISSISLSLPARSMGMKVPELMRPSMTRPPIHNERGPLPPE